MQPLLAAEVSGEISGLIEALHDNARRLEELTAGEVDTVADSEGQTFLLRSAQNHLRHHEAAKQAAIVDALPAHIALLDARGVIISVNEAWRAFARANALSGPEYGIGVNYVEVCDSAQGDEAVEAPQVAAGIRAVLSGGQCSFSIEYPCHAPDEQRRFLMTVTPLADARLTGVVVMHLDITEKRRQEDALRRFGAAMDAIADGLFLTDRSTMSYIYVNDAACRQRNLSRAELLALGPMQLLSKSRAEVERDYDAVIDNRVGSEPLELLWSRPDGSAFWVELRRHAQWSGGRWTIVTLVRDVTERKQAALALRESERRFSDMLGTVQLVSLMLDPESRITYCNQYLLRLTGWQYADVIGKDWPELFLPPEIHEERNAAFAALLASESGSRHRENEILTRSGERRLIRWNNTVLRSGTGDVIGIASIGEDITDQRRAESRLRRLNRVYAVQSGINSLIVHVHDRDELFREACRIAVEVGAFRTAWIGVIDPQTLDGKVVAWHGGDQDFIGQIRLTTRDGTFEHERPACRALRLGEIMICNDIAREPSLAPLKDELLRRGHKSLGCFPLKLAGQPEAVIALFAGERDVFDEEETSLLGDLAANLSFALDNLESEKLLRYAATERARGEDALLRFSSAMDATADAIYLVDRSSMRFIHVNDAACRMQGQTREELLALGPAALLETSQEELECTYDAIIASGADAEPLELLRRRRDGSQAWVELRRHAQRSGERWTIITLVRDITARKAAENRIKRLNRVYAVLSGINTLIVRVRYRDELFREACRVAVEEGGFRLAWIGLVDRNTAELIPVASAGSTQDANALVNQRFSLREDAPRGNTLSAQAIREKRAIFTNDVPNDPRIVFKKEHAQRGSRSMAILPLQVADEAVGVLALYAEEAGFFDDEELKLLTELAGDIGFAIDHIDKRERLDYLSYYDVLTGLANRTLYIDRVAQYMRSAVGGGHKLAVMLIDLERFKNINDSLGQPAGDSLLKQVADWLSRAAGGANLLARIGADHFAAVLPEVRQEGDLTRLIEKTMAAFIDHPFHLNDAVFRVAVKVGVAVFPDDGADAETLFRNAEAALKQAKTSGERYLFYTRTMTAAVAGKLTLENQLRRALDNGEFVLHYQPKVNLASGQITSAEALIRWNDPQTGLVPPGRFIPILEETGLIYDVGRWALRQAIADYLRWRRAGLPVVRIAVNVSPLQLRNRGFVDEIVQVIGIDDHAAAGLELEITESLIMEDIKHNIASLQAIRAKGISIAIDDFGTGFSSLSYLARLPVDTLKIDRSFVIDMTLGPEGLALVSTIINLAHSLKLKVVAEGVETEEQSRLLRVLNCDEIQGYLFSRPVPAETFETTFLIPPSAAAT